MSKEQLSAIDFTLKVLISVVGTVIAAGIIWLASTLSGRSTKITRMETKLDDFMRTHDKQVDIDADTTKNVLNQLRDHEHRLLCVEMAAEGCGK